MTNNFRILIIDDVEDIHADFRKILLSKKQIKHPRLDEMNAMILGTNAPRDDLPPFELSFAYQSNEGVSLVKEALQQDKPFAVAFVDVQMPPGEDGIETIRHIWALDPDIQTVICTAYAKYSWQDLMQRFGDTDKLFVIKKPFDTMEIVQLACSLTKRWNLNRAINEQPAKTPQLDNSSVGLMRKSVDELRMLNEKLKAKK